MDGEQVEVLVTGVMRSQQWVRTSQCPDVYCRVFNAEVRGGRHGSEEGDGHLSSRLWNESKVLGVTGRRPRVVQLRASSWFGLMMMSSVCWQPGFYFNDAVTEGGGDGAGGDVGNVAPFQPDQATAQQASLPASGQPLSPGM